MKICNMLKNIIVFFTIMLILLTTTLGLVAVKQQQFADFTGVDPIDDMYFSHPYDISIINLREETEIEAFKNGLKSAAVFVCFICFYMACERITGERKSRFVERITLKDNVVLLE